MTLCLFARAYVVQGNGLEKDSLLLMYFATVLKVEARGDMVEWLELFLAKQDDTSLILALCKHFFSPWV